MKSIEINVGGKTKTFYRYPQFFTFGLGFGAIVYFVIGILYFIDREWELAFCDVLVANMCLVLCHFYVKNNQLFDYVNDLYSQFECLNTSLTMTITGHVARIDPDNIAVIHYEYKGKEFMCLFVQKGNLMKGDNVKIIIEKDKQLLKKE